MADEAAQNMKKCKASPRSSLKVFLYLQRKVQVEKEAVELLYPFFGDLSICRERFTWSVEKVAARCALHCRSDAECSQCRSFVSFFCRCFYFQRTVHVVRSACAAASATYGVD